MGVGWPTSMDPTPQAVNEISMSTTHQDQPASLVAVLGAKPEAMAELYLKEQRTYSFLNFFVTRMRPKNTLRLVSYNVHWWSNTEHKSNLAPILQTISDCKGDILVLQESNTFLQGNDTGKPTPEAQGQLAAMGYIYSAYDKPPRAEGVDFVTSIWSKFPFISTTQHALGDNRHAIEANIQLPDQRIINLFGTHLDVYDDTEQTRVSEMKKLTQIMEKSRQIYPQQILAGDFNALRKQDYDQDRWRHFQDHDRLRDVRTCSLAIDALEASKFVDSFTKKGVPPPQCTTWSGRRIDYIYLSPTWTYTVEGSYVYHSEASDHIPIVVDFNLV